MAGLILKVSLALFRLSLFIVLVSSSVVMCRSVNGTYDLGFLARDPLRCLASDGDVEVVEGVCYLIWLGVRLSLVVDNCWGCPVSSFLRHDCAEDPHSLFRVSLIC